MASRALGHGGGLSMAKKYRAVYDRDKDGRWNVAIPSVPGCYTYGRTIEQARTRVREALGLFVAHAERATIEDDIRLPAAARQRLVRLDDIRLATKRSQKQLAQAQRAAVRQLRTAGLSFRDSGEILGYTRQRVEQLAKT